MNAGLALIKDPNLAKNRIFVGNIPLCTKEELQSICIPYGKTLAGLVQKNYGFVQFEKEDDANKAAVALHKSTFKGKIITVRNAGHKPPPKPSTQPETPSHNNSNIVPVPMNVARAVKNFRDRNPQLNDCEIIVMNKMHITYAENIENQLTRLLLRVDLLFPNEEGILTKVLTNITARGTLYAVVVSTENVEHNSITVNILHGEPAEHRNMPIDDAVSLISEDFTSKVFKEDIDDIKIQLVPTPTETPVPVKVSRHPDAIKIILSKLIDNEDLSEFEYDIFIKYMTKKRDQFLEGEDMNAPKVQPDPEILLQKKILDIMNKPSVINTPYELFYPTFESIKNDFRLIKLLKDLRVQKSLKILLDSDLVEQVAKKIYC